MYKCPKCGNNVQWRAPSVYAAGYWICSQCGYSPNSTYPKQEKDDEKQKVCAHADS